MTSQDMTPERLEAILSAYGAQPARWPEEEREACEALIARSERARAALAEAAHLDRLLDAAPPAPAADALAARLRDLMPERDATVVPFATRPGRARPWHQTALARAAVVVLAVVGGVGIGIALPEFGGGAGPAAPQENVAQTDNEADSTTSVASADAAADTAMAGFDLSDTGSDGTTAAGTTSGTPVLASLMNGGETGAETVSYVEGSSDAEGMTLAALPLQ